MTHPHLPALTVQRNWIQLPARDVAAASDIGLASVLERQQATDVLFLAEQAGQQATLQALAKLQQARRLLPKALAAKLTAGAVVRTRQTELPMLVALAEAGVWAVQWHVSAPLTALLDPQDAMGLQQALHNATTAGLDVQLRWVVSRNDVDDLRRIQLAGNRLIELRKEAAAPLNVSLTLVPDVRPDAAPRLDLLAVVWPQRQRSGIQRDGGQAAVVPGLRLVRSARWPVCLAGDADDVEAVAASERAADNASWQATCDGCPSRGPCAGFPASLWRALQTSGASWQGGRESAGHRQARPADHAYGFAPDAVELRGLRLGLRQAWRLSLPALALEPWRDALHPLGLTLVASPGRIQMAQGGRMAEGGDGDKHLVVIAADPVLAAACLDRELASLQLVLPRTHDPAAHLTASKDALHQFLATHRFVGQAYGYPACCIEAFCDAFLEVVGRERQGDNALALLRAAWRTRHFEPLLDILVTSPGASPRSPLRHMPCRFDCPASVVLAQQLAAAGPQARPEVPRAIVLLVDGSMLDLRPAAGATVTATAVSAVDQAIVSAHDPLHQQALQEVVPQLLGRAVRLQVTGSGPQLQSQHQDGQWSHVELPQLAGPLAEHFPLLLPFGAGIV